MQFTKTTVDYYGLGGKKEGCIVEECPSKCTSTLNLRMQPYLERGSLQMSLRCKIRWGHCGWNPSPGVLIRMGQDTRDTDAHQREHHGRQAETESHSHGQTRQAFQASTSGWESGTALALHPAPPEGTNPADTLILDLWPSDSEGINSYLLWATLSEVFC